MALIEIRRSLTCSRLETKYMNRAPDEVKRKVTSVLTQIAQQEAKYHVAMEHNATARAVNMKPELPPHLMDIHFLNRNNAIVYVTIEPYTLQQNSAGIQGWDDGRQKFWTFRWDELYDAQFNSTSYFPVDKKEWERRIHESNLQDVEDNWVRQSHANFW